MSKPEKTTLRLVAARAGVSPATASRALNGNSSVDKELARRVFIAARELEYQFNGPSKGKNSITFIVPAIASTYFSYTVTGVIEVAQEAGYQVNLMLSGSDPEQELNCLKNARGPDTAGIILAPVSRRDPREAAPELAGLPIVITGPRHIADGLVHVHLNNEEAAYLSTRYLLRLGRKRIAFVIYYWTDRALNYQGFLEEYNSSDHGCFTAYDRYSGYCRALEEAGLELNPSLLAFGGFSYDSGYSCARKLLSTGSDFDAVIVPNDRCGVGFLNLLQEQGFRVPSQVSLVCLNGDLISKIVSPTLTSIASSDYEIGRRSVEQLIRLIRGEPAQDVQIDAKLSIENSTQYIL